LDIGKTLYVTNRKAWRSWLAKHHDTAKEIWLIYYKLPSGKPRIPYNDAVEEALCYGWIDSIVKPVDASRYAQRFSPRKPKGNWSSMNVERLKRLIRQKKVTRAGLLAAGDVISARRAKQHHKPSSIPPDILRALKRDPKTWKIFLSFPASYKRIRIGWIDATRRRPELFRQRLGYFVRMTAQNKRFGMVQ
jgi:uncharacterized protein YdeI (YjbR/CyaY-like superfamily)